MYGANVLIFEGILSFTSKDLRDVSMFANHLMSVYTWLFSISQLMDMKVFVDTDSDIRLARR